MQEKVGRQAHPLRAFTVKLEFPVGVTELVLFEPKDAPDDQE